MENPTSVRPLSAIFSFPVMLSGLLIVLAVLTVQGRFDDPDMWWHLKTGELIWTTHTVPATDLYSFTTGHHPYVAHEWLAQLLIYGAYRFGGYTGLMLWFCFFTSALLIGGYALSWLYSQNAKVALVGAMTIWLFSTSGLAIRPQVVGYCLLVVELLLLHLGRTRNPRWFFGLPLLFAIWVNCHGTFFLGLLVAAVFLFTSLFSFQIGSLVSPRWDPRCRQIFAWAFALSLAALLVNPVGIKQVLNPLDTLFHQPIVTTYIEEWQPLKLNEARGYAFLGVLGSISLLVLIRRSELLLHEVLMLALAAWLAVNHRRMIFAFGILAAPVLARLLSDTWEGYDPRQDRPLPNAIFIAASVLAVILAFPNQQSLAKQVEQQSPVKAVEFIKANHLSGNMLNDFAYGGYLIWAAPEHPVFVDGRADIFDKTGVLAEFGRWATLQIDPNQLLDKYRIDFCLLNSQAPMANVFPLMHNWTKVYSDDHSVIFRRIEAKTP
jgi:hypothetical protein